MVMAAALVSDRKLAFRLVGTGPLPRTNRPQDTVIGWLGRGSGPVPTSKLALSRVSSQTLNEFECICHPAFAPANCASSFAPGRQALYTRIFQLLGSGHAQVADNQKIDLDRNRERAASHL